MPSDCAFGIEHGYIPEGILWGQSEGRMPLNCHPGQSAGTVVSDFSRMRARLVQAIVMVRAKRDIYDDAPLREIPSQKRMGSAPLWSERGTLARVRSCCLVNHLHLFFIHPSTVDFNLRGGGGDLTKICKRQLNIDCS
jgi:hypothetical protein